MRLLFSVLMLLACTNAISQSFGRVTVRGTVLEQGSDYPLEYATISFINNQGEIVTGGVTDQNGAFTIDVPRGTYDINIEFISYQTQTLENQNITSDITYPTIYLEMDAASLNEVVIRAETTEVQVRLDKKIYNIGQDLTAGGATVSDALNNVPSVTVDVDGSIALRGSDNVKILINGKPSAIAGFGGTDALRQLPAEAIERVEVITSPSARYDAEGTAGILNIILKKERTLGINGSISGSISSPLGSNVTGNINLRTDKFNIFNTTGYYYNNRPGTGYFDNNYFSRTTTDSLGNPITIDPNFDRVIEDRQNDRLRQGFNTNLGIEYFINEQSSITASAFYRLGRNHDETTNEVLNYRGGDLAERNVRFEDETDDNYNFQAALNYENKFNDNGDHKLTADLQYERSKSDEFSIISDEVMLPDYSRLPSEEIDERFKRQNYLAQVDYVLPIGENAQFEAGYRGDFNKNETDYKLFEEIGTSGNFYLNDSISNIFTYEQNVNALYTQYGNKFGSFSFLLGLRVEHTIAKGSLDAENVVEETPINMDFDKEYTGLFPTVNLTYELGNRENITLGYNRRINRPWRWFLNPFPSRASEANIFQGNPDLDPAYSDALDLGYMKRWEKLTLTTSVYYQHETDAFERVQEETGEVTDNGVNIIRTLPINLSTNQRYGFEVGLMYYPARWISLNGSFNYFLFKTDGIHNNINYGVENSSYFGRFSSKIKLPAQIEWQTNAFYRGPRTNAQTRTKGMTSIDMAVSKEVFNDNATITFNVSDLLNTRKRSSFTETPFFNSDSEFQWRPRTFTLSFIYRFNQQKKNMRQQRNGGIDEGEGFEG